MGSRCQVLPSSRNWKHDSLERAVKEPSGYTSHLPGHTSCSSGLTYRSFTLRIACVCFPYIISLSDFLRVSRLIQSSAVLGLLPECNLRLLGLYQSIKCLKKKTGGFQGFFSRIFNSICVSEIRLELTRLELVLEALDGWFILYVRFLVFADLFLFYYYKCMPIWCALSTINTCRHVYNKAEDSRMFLRLWCYTAFFSEHRIVSAKDPSFSAPRET